MNMVHSGVQIKRASWVLEHPMRPSPPHRTVRVQCMTTSYSTYHCDQCHTAFQQYASQVNDRKNVFCSRDCYLIFHHTHRRPWVELACDQCNGTFLRSAPQVRLRSSRLKFCNKQCERLYRDDLSSRFWEKVHRGEADVCWPWEGATSLKTGYGDFKLTKPWRALFGNVQHTGAHRVGFFLQHGFITPGLIICHHCDNPPCVNGAHLFEGTYADNSHDAQRKGRLPFGDRNGSRLHPESYYRVFSPEQKVVLTQLHDAGTSYADLARRYQCAHATIRRAINGPLGRKGKRQ